MKEPTRSTQAVVGGLSGIFSSRLGELTRGQAGDGLEGIGGLVPFTEVRPVLAGLLVECGLEVPSLIGSGPAIASEADGRGPLLTSQTPESGRSRRRAP